MYTDNQINTQYYVLINILLYYHFKNYFASTILFICETLHAVYSKGCIYSLGQLNCLRANKLKIFDQNLESRVKNPNVNLTILYTVNIGYQQNLTSWYRTAISIVR